jgi:hypothetical protein
MGLINYFIGRIEDYVSKQRREKWDKFMTEVGEDARRVLNCPGAEAIREMHQSEDAWRIVR